MSIPQKHPRVAHYMPYWFNDSLAGIDKAARQGYHYIDQDAHAIAADTPDTHPVVIKHWGKPSKDKFTWIWTGEYKGRGRLRREVRRKDPHPHVSIDDRHWSEVKRLRTRRFGPSGRYLTAYEHMVRCKKRGITMCLEAKGSSGFEVLPTWNYLKKLQGIAGAHVIVMTLMEGPTTRERALRRMRCAHAVGFPTALLVHGWAKPADWDTRWAPHVDAVWGWWK